MPHLRRIAIDAGRFPTREHYPFSLSLLQATPAVEFPSPVTCFQGENGSGKSTLLFAIARACRIAIWGDDVRPRLHFNRYERLLADCLRPEWVNGAVPGSFFAAQLFHDFSEMLEAFARSDPGQLAYFGGQSLLELSHGQSLLAFFAARYRIKGLYLLDEPESALSPRSQLQLARCIRDMAAAGHAQFIICTHSPILLGCPGALIYNFDRPTITPIAYTDTTHYRLYRDFFTHQEPLAEDRTPGEARQPRNR